MTDVLSPTDVVDAEVVLTKDDARYLTDVIKMNLERMWDLICQAYNQRADVALGYDSWDEYCENEFGASALRVPREELVHVVRALREHGLSTRAIASATGVSQSTVSRELRESNDSRNLAPVIGLDDKRYGTKPPVVTDVVAKEPRIPADEKFAHIAAPPDVEAGEWSYTYGRSDKKAARSLTARQWDLPPHDYVAVDGEQYQDGAVRWRVETDIRGLDHLLPEQIRAYATALLEAADELERRQGQTV